MFDEKKPLSFLKRITFFKRASKRLMLDTDTYEHLVEGYHQVENNPEEANAIAQKLSIQYGLAGLYFYIPLKLALLSKEQSSEIIGQDLIQLLSLIFYMQKYATEPSEQLWVEEQVKTCRTLCDDETEEREVFNEAADIVTFYPK